MSVEDKVHLFQDKNLVFLATVMSDGSPQVTPVWADFKDGHVLINTAKGRIKHKNILRDSRVAVSVVSKEDFLDMVSIRGKVAEIIPDPDYKHADKLTQQYLGRKHYPFKKEGEERVILKIKPEHVFIMPRLKFNDE